MIQSFCIPPFQHVCLLAGICVMLQWLVSAAEVVLWPWQDTQIHTCPSLNSTHSLGPFHQSSTASSASLSILLYSFLSFSCALPVFLSLLSLRAVLGRQPWNTASFPQLFPRETQMKRYYQPFLSPATLLTINADKRLQYHLWPFTGLSEHTYTHHSHIYYWQCLWISRVWDSVEEFNDTQCRFNFSAPRPGYQVHHLSFIQRRKGGLSYP